MIEPNKPESSRVSRFILRAAVVALVVSLASLVPLWGLSKPDQKPRRPLRNAAKTDSLPTATSNLQVRSGVQLVVAFIGSSTCGASARPELAVAMQRMRERLAAEAKESDRQLVFVGIASDWQLDKGLHFLSGYGPFDEVLVGANWFNSGIVRLVWRDFPGEPSLPQIVITTRKVEVGSTSVSIGKETLMARHVGVDEILRWIDGKRVLVPRS